MGISITLTDNQVYAGLVILLMLIQIYQRSKISNLNKELKQVWTQLAILHFALGSKGSADIAIQQKNENEIED